MMSAVRDHGQTVETCCARKNQIIEMWLCLFVGLSEEVKENKDVTIMAMMMILPPHPKKEKKKKVPSL